jgi:hypothetical protein
MSKVDGDVLRTQRRRVLGEQGPRADPARSVRCLEEVGHGPFSGAQPLGIGSRCGHFARAYAAHLLLPCPGVVDVPRRPGPDA